MPIKIPGRLPAFAVLAEENIFAIPEDKAQHQDIRPLKILILNLMPTKIATETQLLRVLSNTPIQVEVELLGLATHTPKNTHSLHLQQFYKYFNDIKHKRFDGMIITGAPIEQLMFEQVDYWEELCEIIDWSERNVYSVFNICWAAGAALYHKYGIQKRPLEKKLFGVFAHSPLDANHPLLRGFDDIFWVPHSRYTELCTEEVLQTASLNILSVSPQAGLYIIEDKQQRRFYVTGHSEYDRDTLHNEYMRDKTANKPIQKPSAYYTDDDETQPVLFTWRSHAHLLYSNWLNYFVYQQTPFDLTEL